jgi:hypothetical protein
VTHDREAGGTFADRVLYRDVRRVDATGLSDDTMDAFAGHEVVT